jgi:hypothetical protein
MFSREATVPRRTSRTDATTSYSSPSRSTSSSTALDAEAAERAVDVQSRDLTLGSHVQGHHAILERHVEPTFHAAQLVEAAAEDDPVQPGRLVRLVREPSRQPPVRA